jgi:hypothetical protein
LSELGTQFGLGAWQQLQRWAGGTTASIAQGGTTVSSLNIVAGSPMRSAEAGTLDTERREFLVKSSDLSTINPSPGTTITISSVTWTVPDEEGSVREIGHESVFVLTGVRTIQRGVA